MAMLKRKMFLLVLCIFSVSHLTFARESYYTNGVGNVGACVDCHTVTDVTDPDIELLSCSGCHAHGARARTGSNTLNIKATILNGDMFAVGQPIEVKFEGGGGENGEWFGIKVYDQNGKHLDTICDRNGSCDYPVEFTVEASAGLSRLFVSWVGHQFNASPNKPGNTGGGIALGWRDTKQDGHIEEFVQTATFTVDMSLPPVNQEPPADGGNNAPGNTTQTQPRERASVGAFGLWTFFICLMIFVLRVRQTRNQPL